MTYSYDTAHGNTTPDGTVIPRTTVTTSLSPGQQKLYDQNLNLSTSLNDLAAKGLGFVGNATNQGAQANWDGLVRGGSTQGGGITKTGGNTSGVIQGGSSQGGGLITGGSRQGGGLISGGVSDAGQIQSGLDYSGVAKVPGQDDFGAQRDQVVQALMSRYQPMLDQQRNAEETRLANMGINRGSAAFGTSQDQLGRNENDAAMQAILAGSSEQGRLFGQGLAARQQGIGEINTQGQFANQAQQQDYGQALSDIQQNNATVAQRQGLDLQNIQQNNATVQQRQEMDLQNIQQNNAAQQQMFDQGLANSQFNNQAVAQAQGLDLQNIQQNNAAQAQALQQGNYYQTQPLNILNALRSGNQVTMPQFGNVATGASIQAAPIYQATADQGAAEQAAYAQKMAGYGSMLSGLGSIGGAAITKSDRRLKENIEQIGSTPSGLGLYFFNYIGKSAKEIGFMADEVEKIFPEAVSHDENGFAMVDYGIAH